MRSIMDASVSNLYDADYLNMRRCSHPDRICLALPSRLVFCLALVQLMVGLLCVSIQVAAIVVDMDGYYIAVGLFFGFPYLLAGSLGCVAAQKKTVRLIDGFRRFSLISTCCACVLLVAYLLVLLLLILPMYCNTELPYQCKSKLYGLGLILTAMVAAMVSGTLAVIVCKRAARAGARYVSGSGTTQLLHLEDQEGRHSVGVNTISDINSTSPADRKTSISCHSTPRLEPRPATVPFSRQRSDSEPHTPYKHSLCPPGKARLLAGNDS